MAKIVNLAGLRFGRLLVIKNVGTDRNGSSKWLCKCDCGNKKIVTNSNLRNNSTKSCGCLQKENKTKHNKWNTRIYRIYYGIKQRCYNPKYSRYYDYGGRGITVCDEWKNDFMSFYNWAMANGYRDDLTIDRIDVNGNYKPHNCRWISREEQQSNTRKSHFIEYNGKKQTMAQWSRELKLSPNTIKFHLNKGRTIEDVIEYKKKRELENVRT